MKGQHLNTIDRLVAWLSPANGLRRLSARATLNQISAGGRAHEAAETGRSRKTFGQDPGPNQIVGQGAAFLRSQARHMERNSDLARGIIRTLVDNVVGPNGIGVEFQPRHPDGSIHQEYAAALQSAYAEWRQRPEVTRTYTDSAAQRMKARHWLRDGEVFVQHIIGPVAGLQHSTRVPYSLELIDADLCPLDLSDGDNLVQGIERSAWGAPLFYWFYKGNPKETLSLASGKSGLKRVDAARISHLARRDRLGQMRGLSELASVFNRLQDIKEYEDSERIAAKVAAALTAYIKKNSQEGYNPGDRTIDPDTGVPAPRNLTLAPGMIIDGLAVGEEIGLIDSSRPNPNVVTFRQGQLRATAAGVGTSYSSIAKSYDGTFSAQRQELVESWVSYATLTDEFVGQDVAPQVANFVMACHLSGVVPMPKELKPGTWNDALYIAQSMPWIDPLKEANAYVTLVKAGFASEVEVLRKRGVNPRDMLEQIRAWRAEVNGAAHPLVFNSDAAHDTAGPAGAPAETDPREVAAQQ